ncbi:uncharacterized protein LOC111322970 [Stylophora pistillata]|uniref:Myb-like domain-containing protein n=1 Tax=Stylophora pistillata TaxID=50429 RepID=A0A2B4SZC7_STYPI|nr:uncharacterized protein LOC111322970 [Stylophora pistillata]PFX34656.1 hypothetical protein AWC38_SpisGene25809 [Stylophora pistillata]
MSQHPTTVSMATVSNSNTMTVGEGVKTTTIEVILPGQQVKGQEGNGEEALGTINSSRWTDPETMALLSLWRANYRIIKGKKRNYEEWNMIAKEFNRRVAHCSLGPRTGNQCKVRIKNLLAEYKRTKDQLPHSFPYHDQVKEILNNKSDLFREEEVVRINIPAEHTIANGVVTSQTVVTPSPTLTFPSAIPSDTFTSRHLRPIKPAPPPTPLNAPIAASQADQYPIPVQVYSTAISQPSPATAVSMELLHAPKSFASEDESSEDESYSEEMTARGSKRPLIAPTEPLPRKKPRKNPKPLKTPQSRREDLSMIAILREFLEDSRKREEDLLKRILQQQLEAESRYQQFTLDVLKEIGKMFKKE